MKNKVLIVTSKDDPHADYLITKGNEDGLSEQIIRINTEDYQRNTTLTFRQGGEFTLELKDSQKSFHGKEIISVWYRRPKKIEVDNIVDLSVKDFIVEQTTESLKGLYYCLHDSSFWVNPLPAMSRARLKLQQLQLANKIGFKVPKTLVTNSTKRAVAFLREHKSICNKSLGSPYYYIENKLYPYLTRTITSEEELANYKESIELCPILLQELIEKKYDIRVVVLGLKIFSFEIHSQDDKLSEIDFRGKAPHLLKHAPHDLPKSVKSKIITFVKEQGLVYSALDLVLSKSGQYYFIENNCNGQWLWLELMTEIKISDFFLKMLLSGGLEKE